MQSTDIPTKFSIPFANAAGAGFIRTVPTASQIGTTNGAASLTDGFPPLNAQPIASGGVPPFIQDTNGILKAISAWTRWQGAGGQVAWDSAFSSAVGGYPLGALVASATTAGAYWVSTTENNTTNPDSSGAGWLSLFNGLALTNGTASVPFAASQFLAGEGGAANGYSFTGDGGADTGMYSPSPGVLQFYSNATLELIINAAGVAATGALSAATLNTSGLATVGNLSTAGNVAAGTLNVSGNAVANSLSVSDGLSTNNGALPLRVNGYTSSVNVAENSYVPHYCQPSNNANAAVVNNQFGSIFATNGYQILPSGLIIQWTALNVPTQLLVTYSFPIAFPTAGLSISAVIGTNIATTTATTSVGAQIANRAQFQVLIGTPNSGSALIYIIAVGY